MVNVNSCNNIDTPVLRETEQAVKKTAASDEELVFRAQNGSKSAFDELVARYMRRAYSLAYQIVGNSETARDLSQDAFIKIYQSLASFKPEHKFFSWFYRVLTNHCLNYKRRRKIVNWLSLSDEKSEWEAERVFAGEESHDTEYERNQSHVSLHKAIEKLPKKQKMVVILHGIEGMSQAETAEILGITEGTVRSRFFYARDRLRELLKEDRQSS